MSYKCLEPGCEGRLRKRGPNKTANIAKRQIENVRYRYVCVRCKETYPISRIEDDPEIDSYLSWKEGDEDDK